MWESSPCLRPSPRLQAVQRELDLLARWLNPLFWPSLLHGEWPMRIPFQRSCKFRRTQRPAPERAIADSLHNRTIRHGFKVGAPLLLGPATAPHLDGQPRKQTPQHRSELVQRTKASPWRVLRGAHEPGSTLCNAMLPKDEPHRVGRSSTALAIRARWTDSPHSSSWRTGRVFASIRGPSRPACTAQPAGERGLT